jgi:hypothetical protein
MKTRNDEPRRCQNDACPRPAEPAGEWCAECELERMLFHREEREPARPGAHGGR